MKKIYVMRMSENWNPDFIEAHSTLRGVAESILKLAVEDEYYPEITAEELIKIMGARERFVDILLTDDAELEEWIEKTGMTVTAILLEK